MAEPVAGDPASGGDARGDQGGAAPDAGSRGHGSPAAGRRVLQLLGPSAGGIRRHVAALVEGLAGRGWCPEVAGPAGVMDGLGRQDHVVAVPSVPWAPALVGARRMLTAVAGEVDVVHAHGLKAGWLASTVAGARPLVVTVHNLVLDEAAGRRARPLRVLEGRLPRRADMVIAVSEEVAARFAGIPGAERVRVVRPVGPPPVPRRDPAKVRADLGLAPEAPLVVCVARLHPQKDLPTLFRAAAGLRDRFPDLAVVVVGEGSDEAALRALIGELGLDGTVRLAGPRPQAADEIAAADVVAVSSLWESGPLVVAEALELARPVVSTPVGFVPELIEDGVSGRVVPVGDPGALAEALGDMLSDPDRATALGRAGQQAVRRSLGAERLVGEVAAIYDEVTRR